MCSETTGRTLCQFHLQDHLKYYPYLEMTETTKVGFRLPLLKSLHSEQCPVEHWICEILTSDLVCITMASNFRDDHILDKITIMYTYASRAPQ